MLLLMMRRPDARGIFVAGDGDFMQMVPAIMRGEVDDDVSCMMPVGLMIMMYVGRWMMGDGWWTMAMILIWMKMIVWRTMMLCGL